LLVMVCQTARIYMVSFPGPGVWRMVRISQQTRDSITVSERREMERLLSRSERIVPVLEDP
jgi:hypothetical protein